MACQRAGPAGSRGGGVVGDDDGRSRMRDVERRVDQGTRCLMHREELLGLDAMPRSRPGSDPAVIDHAEAPLRGSHPVREAERTRARASCGRKPTGCTGAARAGLITSASGHCTPKVWAPQPLHERSTARVCRSTGFSKAFKGRHRLWLCSGRGLVSLQVAADSMRCDATEELDAAHATSSGERQCTNHEAKPAMGRPFIV